MNIILLGPPGAGKGTQADLIQKEFGIAHISTGDILRSAVKEGTELGKKAKSYMDEGGLVPDEVVIGIIKERLKEEDTLPGFMLDGFPRNAVQANALNKMLEELSQHSNQSRHIDHVIYLEVPQEELIKRLTQRADQEGRSDDNEQTVRNRILVYFDQTSPLIDYYEDKGLLHRINGLGEINKITQDIFQILKK